MYSFHSHSAFNIWHHIYFSFWGAHKSKEKSKIEHTDVNVQQLLPLIHQVVLNKVSCFQVLENFDILLPIFLFETYAVQILKCKLGYLA